MRIIIDMQSAQLESRYRDSEQHVLRFAQAVVHNCGEHEVILVLSGLFPDTIEYIRTAFDGLLSQENIRVWQAPELANQKESINKSSRETAELLREAFLANLKPDIVHICSFLKNNTHDSVISIGKLDVATLVSVSFYDFGSSLESFFDTSKLDSLKKASLFFVTSENIKNEIINYLWVDELKVVNICESLKTYPRVFYNNSVSEQLIFEKFLIKRSFVLYTGSTDKSKNFSCLIEAWATLPVALRTSYQLLFVGNMSEDFLAEVSRIAHHHGLQQSELLFSSYFSDKELEWLYNRCELFILLSDCMSFGQSALAAMACGAPVIGATGLSKVIGYESALFDPLDVKSITKKLTQALQDADFRQRLRVHGQQQVRKFSWDETAKRVIVAWEALFASSSSQQLQLLPAEKKPRLAFVSPLPPERTGIADYSAELLPELAVYYDIDLIVNQSQVDIAWAKVNGRVRDAAWLKANVSSIDCVLYHMGNSHFHAYMFELLQHVPGVVVLHDFYLSGLMSWLELTGAAPSAWITALYKAHGYYAVRECYHDIEHTKIKYPVNWHILQYAQGIIVHSEYSRLLAKQWYGKKIAKEWSVIPLLRSPDVVLDKQLARESLGIDKHDFVVCSFGFLGATKLNHRALHAWLSSCLSTDKRCHLIFVGEVHKDDYGVNLIRTIRKSGLQDRIRITGFITAEFFHLYLAAADIAIQLRTHSRGETSAAVLDCMNHGLPLIVNANGSMAELDAEAVWLLPDDFDDTELIDALETLWRDPAARAALSERAKAIIRDHHTPEKCANQYAKAINYFYQKTTTSTSTSILIDTIAKQKNLLSDEYSLIQLSNAIATNLPLERPAKRLYLDITATHSNDLKTGIERVVKALLLALLELPPVGYRIEPVYLSDAGGVWHYRHASSYTLSLLGCSQNALQDQPVDPQCGDVLVGLDISGERLICAEQSGLHANYRNLGCKTYHMIHDLLPLRMPEVFPPGTDEKHKKWLASVLQGSGAICISRAVADDLQAWVVETTVHREVQRPFDIRWLHLGADLSNSAVTTGLPNNAEAVLNNIRSRPSFLMVGTIEPRKGYLQTINAFNKLWSEGIEVNLVIVGHEGWKGLSDKMRRDIPKTVKCLRTHPERGKHLFWLEGISDEYLEKIYAICTCLIAASYGEGFGLPLIEAAQHKLPIIARDIPVFREVTRDSAYYFYAETPEKLAQSIKAWLKLYGCQAHPKSDAMPWLTWKESANCFSEIICGIASD